VATLAQYTPLVLAQVLDYVPRPLRLTIGTLAGGTPGPAGGQAIAAEGYIANHPGLAEAPCVGHIGVEPDADGTVRHLPMRSSFDGQTYKSLSWAMLACIGVTLDAATLDSSRPWRVPFRSQLEAYTVVSASDLLSQQLPPGLLQGRHVLVGSSSLGLGDKVSTPLSPLAAGVMVHAAALQGLLDLHAGAMRPAVDGAIGLTMWCMLSFAILGWWIPRVGAGVGLSLLTAMSLLWMMLWLAAWRHQITASPTAALWGYVWLVSTAIPLEWWLSQQRGRRLMNTLSHYVSQPVLEQILADPQRHSLEPRRLNVTALVADMASYTQLTSTLQLETAAEITRSFLDCLTRPVLAWGGTLDRYSGDGLVAFWGAPIPDDQAADRAVTAALDMISQVHMLSDTLASRGLPRLRVRIGIESGWALVGDLGTDFRSTYTAVGDCINFASRLENEARNLGVDLVIGPRAAGAVKQHALVTLGAVALRNTATTIEVFGASRSRMGADRHPCPPMIDG
jgi:adenylate cyclase